MYQQNTERDELRARFTRWMEVLLLRARRQYLQKKRDAMLTVSLDDLPETAQSTVEPPVPDGFNFEADWLAEAFEQLSPKRQEVLTLIFAEERKPNEIAQLLHCSPQQVYDRQYQALQSLRRFWEKNYHDAR